MCTLWGLKYLLSGCLFAVSWPLQAAELSLPSSALVILILLSPPQYSNMLPSQGAFLRYPYIDGRLHLFLCSKATLSLRPLLSAPFKAATLLPSTCYIPSVSFFTRHVSLLFTNWHLVHRGQGEIEVRGRYFRLVGVSSNKIWGLSWVAARWFDLCTHPPESQKFM